MKKPELLFLCHRIPYPPNKGDKIRSFHLLNHLRHHFDVHLATFVDDKEDWQWAPEVEKLCKSALFLPLDAKRARLRSLSGLLEGLPLSVAYYRNQQMQAWVTRQSAENDIERVLVFSSSMAQYVLSTEQVFKNKVIDFVDIDSDKWMQYANRTAWPMKLVYRREGKTLLKYEKLVAQRFDAGLFVSSAEAQMFRELAPGHAEKIGHFNNGVNADYFHPSPDYPNPYPAGSQVLVFTGAMDYWPNVDAVDWFAHVVFPVLRAANPNLYFYIVGSSPSAVVKDLSSLQGVEVTGRVEDVRPYLQHSLAAVAPLRIARGVQNKVLEAMAMAKPVVVSTLGLEGITATNGKHVMLADSTVEYAHAVEQIVRRERDNLGAVAREFVTSNFSWESTLPEVVLLLNAAFAPPRALEEMKKRA